MGKKDCLDLAKSYYYKQNFPKAELFLLECVKRNHRSPEVFKYLGLTYICQSDYENAKRALRKYDRSIEKEDLEVLNAQAFLKLKENQINHAVSFWLDILKIDKHFTLANRNLDRIKNNKNKKTLYQTAQAKQFLFLSHFELGRFFASHSLLIWLIVSSLSVGIAIYLLLPAFKKTTTNSYLPSVVLEKSNDYIEQNGKAMFHFSNKDVPYLFKKIKKLMKKQKYNKAIIWINKVLHSNIKEINKEKFLMLKDFVSVPENYNDIKLYVKLRDIINSPTVYQGCYVVIDGNINKIFKTKILTKFALTSKNGYEILVSFPYDIQTLKREDSLRILGRFQYVESPGNIIVVKGIKIWIKKENFVEVQ